MPYKIEKRGEQWCVLKESDGKQIACHDSEAKAKAQIAAISASENKKTLERYTQEAVAYTPVSTNGQMCAGCRWFIGVNQGGNACHIIDNFPIDIEPTGYCNEYAGLEAAIVDNALPTIAEAVVQAVEAVTEMQHDENKAHGETAHAHEEAQTLYIAPQPENALKKLVGRLQRGLKPGASVFKGADGARYMLVVTSNSYQDRDEETITTQALKEDTDRAWIADDLFHTDNPLLFWHDDRLEVGEIVYADVKTPFLVELAREADNPVAKAVFDYREANPNEEWGASHRFGYFKKDRSPDGTYRRIFKQETTILPRDAAANLLTFSGVIPMTTKRDEYLNKMLGLPNAAELLDKGIGELVAELNKRGVEHKSADKPTDAQVVQEASKEFGTLMIQLMDSQTELMEKQDALESGVGTSTKSVNDETTALKAQLKTLADEVAALKLQLDQRSRSASRAVETEVEAKDLANNLKNSLTHIDPMWGRVKDTP